MILLVGTVAYSLFQRRRQRQQEENRVSEEITDLRNAAFKAQMNPHFIFNCLNSIQSFVNQKRDDDATRYISHFSKLIRKCLDASIQHTIPLSEEIEFIRHYLALEKMRFSPKFDFTIDIHDQISPQDIVVTPMLVLAQPFASRCAHGWGGRKLRPLTSCVRGRAACFAASSPCWRECCVVA